MKTFKDFLEYVDEQDYKDEQCLISEALITFGGKAYPNFGNIVILAGGAGSGKGFSLKNLVGLEGKVFDVDALKTMAMKSPKIVADVEKEFGVDISKLDLSQGEHVRKLHDIVGDKLNLPNKKEAAMMTSVLTAHPDRKPNLIFDVTLKSVSKLVKISDMASQLGYDKKNIHIVWVLNSVDVAMKQNKERSRVVDKVILLQTHEGVSSTTKHLLTDVKTLRKYMDGDFWISANKYKVDSKLKKSKLGGQYINKTNMWKVKEQGKNPISISDFEEELLQKLSAYVPKSTTWKV